MLPSQYVKQGWCQHTFAKDRNGLNINFQNISAEKWCAEGALRSSLFNNHISERQYEQLRSKIQYLINTVNISMWNDTPGRQQDEVINVLNQAEYSLELELEKELVLV